MGKSLRLNSTRGAQIDEWNLIQKDPGVIRGQWQGTHWTTSMNWLPVRACNWPMGERSSLPPVAAMAGARLRFLYRRGYQQAAAGLRVAQDVAGAIIHGAQLVTIGVEVAQGTARYAALHSGSNPTSSSSGGARSQTGTDAGTFAHLQQVACQSKTGHVGRGVYAG